MSADADHVPRVLAIDAGGTMTDTFIVDQRRRVRRRQGADDAGGRVGWASWRSAARRARAVGHRRPRTAFPRIASRDLLGAPRCSTGCSRGRGCAIGAIVTAGQEDYAADRARRSRPTSATPTPTACTSPRTTTTSRSSRASSCTGVRGRIDLFGDEVLPLREEDARDAAGALLDARRRRHRHLPAVRATATPMHEQRTAEIVARGDRRARA